MEMGLRINTRNQIFTYIIINLKLNLGDGSLYGNANTIMNRLLRLIFRKE